MTDSNGLLPRATDVAAGCLAYTMGLLVAAPFMLILASPFAIGW